MRQSFIESSNLLEYLFSHHHTVGRHGAEILDHVQPAYVPVAATGKFVVGMGGETSEADNDAAVLNRIVRIIQFRPHGADVVSLCKFEHGGQPFGSDHFRSVIQEEEKVRR